MINRTDDFCTSQYIEAQSAKLRIYIWSARQVCLPCTLVTLTFYHTTLYEENIILIQNRTILGEGYEVICYNFIRRWGINRTLSCPVENRFAQSMWDTKKSVTLEDMWPQSATAQVTWRNFNCLTMTFSDHRGTWIVPDAQFVLDGEYLLMNRPLRRYVTTSP